MPEIDLKYRLGDNIPVSSHGQADAEPEEDGNRVTDNHIRNGSVQENPSLHHKYRKHLQIHRQKRRLAQVEGREEREVIIPQRLAIGQPNPLHLSQNAPSR